MALTLNTLAQEQAQLPQRGHHVCRFCEGYGTILSSGSGLCDGGVAYCRHCPAGERERLADAAKKSVGE